MSWTDCDGKL